MYSLKRFHMTLISIVFLALPLVISLLAVDAQLVGASPRVITVDDDRVERPDADFTSIQEAIDAANPGDTICVYSGMYYENLVINKTLSLIGQGPRRTIISNRLYPTRPVIYVTADNVVIRGFCIEEETYVPESRETIPPRMIGIYIHNASGNEISYNAIMNNKIGIYLHNSNNNIIHHNNFFTNTVQAYINGSSLNIWDNGYPSGGNYWNDHVFVEHIPEVFGGGKRYCGPGGIDMHSGPHQNETGGDGISDVPYTIDADNKDRYPLMDLVNLFIDGWLEVPGWINIVSNSTISDFHFNPDEAFIMFNVTGDSGTIGYCKVAIPKQLLWTENGLWNVLVDGTPITPKIYEDDNSTYLYFTYNHSTKTVEIKANRSGSQPQDNKPSFPMVWIVSATAVASIGIAVLLTYLKKARYHATRSVGLNKDGPQAA
jgi:parallel beta-helix repeat protein